MDPPIKPDESDCCNSGCNPCILDVYEEELEKYNKLKEANLAIGKVQTNCLSTTTYTIFRLIEMEKHGDDAYLFTFEYVHSLNQKITVEEACILYNPGQYFLLKGGIRNDEFTRAYTPIPTENKKNGQFTTLIKIYEIGRMSNYLRRKVSKGVETHWRGPYRDFTISYDHKFMLLIAQGTGITPIYSVICDILKNENCYTFLKLFYCCKSSNRIYLRDYLYKLQSYWNFTYEVFLGNSENISEKYNETIRNVKLDATTIEDFLFDKFDKTSVLICGSENFTKSIKKLILKSKVPEEKITVF